ncbi:MAG: hypothetical protein VR70_09810 [Rhodospirillaceae bacterium BRH_c57]|nr:MAG: hypothetical protein VR70_09810 [Rhodospirillaceae bacterium BRH_c57]
MPCASCCATRSGGTCSVSRPRRRCRGRRGKTSSAIASSTTPAWRARTRRRMPRRGWPPSCARPGPAGSSRTPTRSACLTGASLPRKAIRCPRAALSVPLPTSPRTAPPRITCA